MAAVGFSIDGFKNFEKWVLEPISLIFIDSFSKIDGFENPLLKIDGFGRTHANAATDKRTGTFIFGPLE